MAASPPRRRHRTREPFDFYIFKYYARNEKFRFDFNKRPIANTLETSDVRTTSLLFACLRIVHARACPGVPRHIPLLLPGARLKVSAFRANRNDQSGLTRRHFGDGYTNARFRRFVSARFRFCKNPRNSPIDK